jgi:hypothetical protein
MILYNNFILKKLFFISGVKKIFFISGVKNKSAIFSQIYPKKIYNVFNKKIF